MMQDIRLPKLIDNGRGAVIVTVDGRQVRGFSYQGDSERALKMRLAREFIEGWVEGAIHSARWDAA